MQAVDRADERWVDAVAEHPANVLGDRSGDVARHRQGVGLHGSQPRLAILGGDGKTLAGAGVGASAMPQGAHEKDARAGGHDDGYRPVVWARPALTPPVAAGYD